MTTPKPQPTERPEILEGFTRKMRTGHGTLYVTINSLNDKPFEVFATQGKSGGCNAAHLEAITRLISNLLRSDVEVPQITRQLEGITCCPNWVEPPKGENKRQIKSTPDAIAWVLKDHMTALEEAEEGGSQEE